MSDNDLIRRGDALAVLRDEIDLARIAMPQCVPILAADMRAIAALPAADPLADPRVQALVEAARQTMVEAARQTMVASELREVYHRLPNDKNRIGDPKSRKAKARDAWLKAFRRASSATAAALAALAEIEGEKG
jgi:hypothetical protein